MMQHWRIHSGSEQETHAFGQRLGARLRGGEIIELSSDLGGGKTALTKGIVAGIGSTDSVSSPTFTISNEYVGDGLTIRHYDFYRLEELGLMKDEITETMTDPSTVSVVEWAGEAHDIFDPNRLVHIEIALVADDENARDLIMNVSDTLRDRFSDLDVQEV